MTTTAPQRAKNGARSDRGRQSGSVGVRGANGPQKANLRDALTRRLAWMGPDAKQAVGDVMDVIEEELG